MGANLEDKKYVNNHRFTLYREWMGTGGTVNFIMLNPSTADDKFDDPTIRKCIGFAKRWGFRRLSVTNLYAFRATDPSDLKILAKIDYRRAVGDGNDGHLIREASSSQMVCAAWGNHGVLYGRDLDVVNRVLPDVRVYCIGFTGEQNPLHPSRTPYISVPIPFRSIIGVR